MSSTAAAAKTPTKPLGPAAAGARTPTKPKPPAAAAAKAPCPSRARPSSHASENSNPNIQGTPPSPQPAPSKAVLKSPASAGARYATAKKKIPTPAPAPAPAAPPPERERRFLVAKKGARRRRNVGTMGGGGGEIDFRQAAREALRASQGEFFRKELAASTATGEEQLGQEAEEEKPVAEVDVKGGAPEERQEEETDEGKPVAEVDVKGGALEERQEEETDAELQGSSKVRAMRTKAMAKAMTSVPDPGSGRVKHMVQAFESLLNISGTTSDAERAGEGSWALPGLQLWKEEPEGDLLFPPVSVFSSADFQNAGPNRLCSSLDGNTDRLSCDSGRSAGKRRDRRSSAESLRMRASAGGRRSRRSSAESLRMRASAGGRRSRRNETSESLRTSSNKKFKFTSQNPFKLRTEQRGKLKEQQFVQKVQEMLIEEEKKRIHVAQGLPWTTDQPECVIKPAVKERTEPIELVLHSDVRALERAEFDQHVLERNKFAEQQRLEWERQQELEEEERIKILRRTELIPKAQPMPYFDRPFIPKRSTKPATVPVEPKFHLKPEKLSCNVWSIES